MIFSQINPQIDWLQLVSQIGITAALLLAFVWKSWQEKADMSKRIAEVEVYQRAEKTDMSKRIATIEDYQRMQMTEMIKETSLALANSTKALNDNTTIMGKFMAKLEGMRDVGNQS
jgi:hypothetical protein